MALAISSQSPNFTYHHAEPSKQDSTIADNYSVSNSQEDGWMEKIRLEVYTNRKVERLYITIDWDDALFDYWIIIPHRDIDLVRELLKDQQDVIDLFAGTVHPPFQLDFHIVYREGREARDLVPDKAIEIPNL